MLSTISNREEWQTLIIDRDKFPVKIGAGNPFLSPQELQFPREARLSVASHLMGSTADENVEAFRKKQIFFASSRIARMPNSVQLLNNLGISHLNNGNLDNAIQCFERAIQIEANHFPSLANLAKAYFLKGETDHALEIYLNIEKKQPNNISLLSNIAQLFLTKQEFKRAYEYLKRVLKQDENNITALNNIGTILLLENKAEKAITCFRRALSVKNDYPAALNNLGVSFTLIKSYKKAVKYFLSAWSINRSSLGYVLNLAKVYQTMELHDKAIRILEDYLARGFENQKVRDSLAYSFTSLKDYSNSLKQLMKSLKIIETTGDNQQEKTRVYNNIAVVYQYMRDFKAAEEFLDLCLQNEVLQWPIPLYNAIELYFRKNKDECAKEHINRGIKEFPDDPKFLCYLGRYYFGVQDYEKSLEILGNVVKDFPRIIDSYATISVIEIEVKRNWKRAHEVLMKGLLIHPNEVSLLNNLAYCYLMQDDIIQARENLDKIKAKDNIFVIATRGLLLMKEGDLQEGLHLYNMARSIALENGDERIALLLEQKKYLEEGKYYLKNGNIKEAARLFKKVLAIETKPEFYLRDARELLNTIE